MKTSFGKKIAVICLSAAVACGLGVGFNSIKPVEAASQAYDVQSILAVYGVNTVVKVTDDALTDAEVNSGMYAFPKTHNIGGEAGRTATIDVITYPDGIVKKVGDTLTLSQVGKYTIAYKLVENKVSTVYYDTFNVNNSFYTLKNNTGTIVAKSIFTDIKTIDGLTDEQIQEIISINNIVERDAITDAIIKEYFKGKVLDISELSSTVINKIIKAYSILPRHAMSQTQLDTFLGKVADTNGLFRTATNAATSYPLEKLSDALVEKILAKYEVADKASLTQQNLVDYFTGFYVKAEELSDAQKADIKAKYALTDDNFTDIVLENYFKGYFLSVSHLSDALKDKIKAAYEVEVITQDLIDAYFTSHVILESDLTNAQAGVVVDAYKLQAVDAVTQTHINNYFSSITVVNEDLTSEQASDIVALYGLTKPMAITKEQIDKYFGDKFPNKPAGIELNITAGTEVIINEAVDLNELTYDDNGLADVIRFNPQVKNGEDKIVDAYDIKFADVNNPDKYFVARITNSMSVVGFGFGTYTNALPWYGVTAKGVGHIQEKADGTIRVVYIDGVRYVFYKDKAAGMGQGYAQWVDYGVAYNPVKQEVYLRSYKYDYTKGTWSRIDSIPIGFLNNKTLYGENAELFEGFSTGKFTVSVSAVNLSVSSSSFDIYSIGNYSGAELMNRYDVNNIEDVIDPIVKINVEQTDVGGLYGILGSKFAIPSAEVIDVNPINNVSVRVYKNYESSKPVFVGLNSDNTFTIAEKAAYTIEYTAYDTYGNKGVSTIKVNPVTVEELAGYNVNNEFKLKLGSLSMKTGSQFAEPIFEVMDTINSKSAFKLNVKVTHFNSEVFNQNYTYADFADGIPTFDFLPVSAGDYAFTYTYSDNLNSGSYTKTVNCVASNEYRIVEEEFVNRAYVLGATYKAPVLNIHKFAEVIEINKSNVEISYDNGASWSQLGATFKVGFDGNTQIEGATSVMFKFELPGSGLAPYVSSAKPIIDTRKDTTGNFDFKSNIDMTKFFLYDESLVEVKEDANVVSPVFKVKEAVDEVKISFMNPLTYNERGEFLAILGTKLSLSNFTTLTYVITDAHNSSNKLVATMQTVGSDSTIAFNGGATNSISAGLFSTDTSKPDAVNALNIKYNFTNQMFLFGGSEFSVPFELTNGMFYIDFILSDISGTNAGLLFTSFGNQQISMFAFADSGSPLVNYVSSAGSYEVGTELVIAAPIAADIFTPVLDSDLSVKVNLGTKKNAPFVKAVDGTLLDGSQDPTKNYVIKITEFETYKVTYEAKDATGRSVQVNYRITGVDMVPPVITLNYGFTENTVHNVTLGKPFSIEYTVTDNITEEDKMMTYIVLIHDKDKHIIFSRLPQEVTTGKYDLITDTCTITRRGMYTLYIYAMDESKNASIASYKVNVQ